MMISPELTEGLVSMLWPHYLRHYSIAIDRGADPNAAGDEDGGNGARRVWRLAPAHWGQKNTVCRYRTTRDLTLNPLAIEEAVMTAEPDGRLGPATTIRL